MNIEDDTVVDGQTEDTADELILILNTSSHDETLFVLNGVHFSLSSLSLSFPVCLPPAMLSSESG